jgi:hypothetical protein
MCIVIHKTTSKLEHMILTTMYLAGAKNTGNHHFSLLKYFFRVRHPQD